MGMKRRSILRLEIVFVGAGSFPARMIFIGFPIAYYGVFH